MKLRTIKRRNLRRRAAVISGSFKKFVITHATGGNLLLVALIISLVGANSSYAKQYHAFWEQTSVGFDFGALVWRTTLLHFINDGLMTVFFFLVGLEIKRELLNGELASVRKALFPVGAALGGMLMPAVFYALLQPDAATLRGWAVPTATDIAFALGILSFFGSRVPVALTVFLTALAIVDDIGAVLLIGVFYSAPPVWSALGVGLGILLFMFMINRLGVQSLLAYLAAAAALWGAFMVSGVHPTLAGVLAAFAVPAAGRFDCPAAVSPLQRLEHQLHPLVSYVILPIFALANGGVTVENDLTTVLLQPLSLGVIAGLCLGKPLGIVGACWLMEKCGLALRPGNLSWRYLWAGGCFAGIGFTMSIFIANLAFSEPLLLEEAKLAVLAASVLSTFFGALLLDRRASVR